MIFNKPDPVQFRAALVKAGFYAQWQKTYGAEAWAQLGEIYGPADLSSWARPNQRHHGSLRDPPNTGQLTSDALEQGLIGLPCAPDETLRRR